jgi:hypothetical protein
VRAGVEWPDVLRIEGLRLIEGFAVVEPAAAAARSKEACETPARGAVG